MALQFAEGTTTCEVRLVRQHESLDCLPVHDMPLDELGHVGNSHVAVPNLLGIDHDRHAMSALIETTGIVRSDFRCQPAGRELVLDFVSNFSAAFRLAAAFGMAGGAFVDAHEYVT